MQGCTVCCWCPWIDLLCCIAVQNNRSKLTCADTEGGSFEFYLALLVP
jgi:hypothetical protein